MGNSNTAYASNFGQTSPSSAGSANTASMKGSKDSTRSKKTPPTQQDKVKPAKKSEQQDSKMVKDDQKEMREKPKDQKKVESKPKKEKDQKEIKGEKPKDQEQVGSKPKKEKDQKEMKGEKPKDQEQVGSKPKKEKDQKEMKGEKPKDQEKVGSKPKKEKESPLVVQARKRSKQRESMSWKDYLSKKDQERLLSKDAIVQSDTSKFHSEMLKVHNLYRADHGAPNLKMSRELNREAQERAEAIVAYKNIGQNAFGENTFTTTFTDSFKSVPSALQVCSEWYEYAAHFNYKYQAKFPPKALKFMQMVWEGEREMGAGRATNGRGMTVVVALYRPKAELPWSIRQNVKPPLVPRNHCTFQHEHVPYKSEDQPVQPNVTVKRRTTLT